MKNKQFHRVMITLIVLLTLLFLATACTTSPEAESEPADTGEEVVAEEAAEPVAEEEDEPVAEEEEEPAAETDKPIKVGHLTYHTGPFGFVGPHFDGATEFPLQLINENPPLGRPMEAVHQDIGTIGEAQAARKLVESEGVEVLLNPAHEYLSYRDWILQYIEDEDLPIMPSVHAGSVDRNYGGTIEEPLFRGSPMDSAQGAAAVLQASEAGAESIAIIAAEIAGMQLQKEAALNAAEELGLEVVAALDIQPEQPSYRSEISRIQGDDPDALIIFMVAEDGGTIVKNAAEAGMSKIIVGTTEWLFEEFPQTATMSAIDQHEAVWAVGFTHTDSPAWEYFEPRWNDSEYAELADASNSYTLQYYDLLNLTALAIESAGTTDASVWAEHVRRVAEPPGKIVYTYEEGIEALRNGEEIDYSGVAGEMNYTDTGVVSGLFGVFEWANETEMERVDVLDGARVLELDQQ